MKLTPVYGDTIYYEIGGDATKGSMKVLDSKAFKTRDLRVSFLCVDTKGEHEPEVPKIWSNRITIKSRPFDKGPEKMIELRAAPEAPIRYTTDGSDPKILGAAYDGPFVVPKGTVFVLAVAEKNGIISEQHKIKIDWK